MACNVDLDTSTYGVVNQKVRFIAICLFCVEHSIQNVFVEHRPNKTTVRSAHIPISYTMKREIEHIFKAQKHFKLDIIQAFR